jgi:glycosyltransferase involved in cell wall biosynthesis
MRIGFDIGPLTPTRTGVGNYCYYLLKHLVEIAPPDSFVGFSSGRGGSDLGELAGRLRHRHVPVPTRLLYGLWRGIGSPGVDRLLGGVDIYHATNYFLPPTARAKRVVTIHDLAFLAAPELHSGRVVGPFAEGMRRYAGDAHAVMAYSEATKRDVVRLLDVPAEKVTVAHMAVDDGFKTVPEDQARAYVRNRCGVDGPFLLYVSTLEPRKNVAGLLEVFAKVAPDLPHSLVLVGNLGPGCEGILDDAGRLGVADRIVHTGFVPHMETPHFYCAADAFLFPTHYEGFGLPLLEALTCGCPVVTSNNSAVPEVVGEAALCHDADDVEGLAESVKRVVADEALRVRLIEAGRRQATRFSWPEAAKTTWSVYESLVAAA